MLLSSESTAGQERGTRLPLLGYSRKGGSSDRSNSSAGCVWGGVDTLPSDGKREAGSEQRQDKQKNEAF